MAKSYQDVMQDLNEMHSGFHMEGRETSASTLETINKGQQLLQDLHDQKGVVAQESRGMIQNGYKLSNDLLTKFLVHPEIICMENKEEIMKLRAKNLKITQKGIDALQKQLTSHS